LPDDTAEKFPLEISYEIAQANSEFVSALVRYGGYQGGAHGYENTVSFNYDVVNQKIMSLSDLFPEDANYLETLSSFSKQISQANSLQKKERNWMNFSRI
jgi:hypothetical protein